MSSLAGCPECAGVLARAVQQGRVLLTRNCGDFLALHCQSRAHPGILAIYQGADPAKNMGYAAIVRSVANFVGAEVPLTGSSASQGLQGERPRCLCASP